MAQQADIVINDGQATPVAHTFVAKRIDGKGIAHWADIASGISLAYIRLSLLVKEMVSSVGQHRVSIKFSIPKMDTSVTPNVLAYVNTADVVFLFDVRATEQERKDAVAYVKNCLGITAISDGCTKLVSPS